MVIGWVKASLVFKEATFSSWMYFKDILIGYIYFANIKCFFCCKVNNDENLMKVLSIISFTWWAEKN